MAQPLHPRIVLLGEHFILQPHLHFSLLDDESFEGDWLCCGYACLHGLSKALQLRLSFNLVLFFLVGDAQTTTSLDRLRDNALDPTELREEEA